MSQVQEYVVGFLFNHERDMVVLIQKTKPKWQAGYLNGVGGKIESKDVDNHHLPMTNAMVREFLEETGVKTYHDDWRNFATMRGKDWVVYCFVCFDTNALNNVSTTSEERIVVVPISKLKDYQVLSNIPWLLPMALDENMGNDPFFANIFY